MKKFKSMEGTNSTSFLKTDNTTEQSTGFDKKKLENSQTSANINDQINLITSKYSIIKNKLNELWNKID